MEYSEIKAAEEIAVAAHERGYRKALTELGGASFMEDDEIERWATESAESERTLGDSDCGGDCDCLTAGYE